MLNLIDQNTANRIKEILENTWLHKDLEIQVGSFKLKAASVSETRDTEHHKPFRMKEFYLLNSEDEYGVLNYKDKSYDVFINIGQWGYETRLFDTHITLGSSKFHDFCFQMELSQAVDDEKYIYIIKNVTNMAGPGAICRLYRGLKGDRAEKLKRQNLFIEQFGGEVLRYEGKDWIIISKLAVEDLYDESKCEEIFYNLTYNMVRTMLLVEGIGSNYK